MTFRPEIVTAQDNFNEKYSDLAQGFHLIDQDFQGFMMQKMLGHDSYKMVLDVDGQTVPLLNNTLMQAQEEIKKSIGKPFCDTICDALENNTDLNDIQNPIFGYTLKTEFLEPELKAYVNTYKYINQYNTQEVLLVSAIRKNNLQIMQFLIDIDADINLPYSCNIYTPIQYAIMLHRINNNLIGAIKLLLHAPGININQTDLNGRTILHKAAEHNLLDTAQLLLNFPEIDINLKDFLGCTPLHSTFAHGQGINHVALLLLDSPDIKLDEVDRIDQTPLHKAGIYDDNGLVVQALIDRGANINKQDNQGETPLHKAVYNTRMTIVPILLAAGADMAVRNSRNETVIDIARIPEMHALLKQELVRRQLILTRAVIYN